MLAAGGSYQQVPLLKMLGLGKLINVTVRLKLHNEFGA